jgi:mannosyltransferase
MKPAGAWSKWGTPGILFLLALALRIYRLNQSFWYDEVYAVTIGFHASWIEMVTRMPPFVNHHPLYALMAKPCLLLLGEKEWTVRLPSLLFGSLTPPLLYRLGARWMNHRVGLLAGLFMAVAMWPVCYSQDARGYAAMIFFSLLATDRFLVMTDQPSRGGKALYVLSAVAAGYAHLYSLALVAAHLAAALILALRREKRVAGLRLAALSLTALAGATLVYAPMISGFIRYAVTWGQRLAGANPASFAFIAHLFLGWAAGEGHPWLSLLVLAPAAAGLGWTLSRQRTLALVWLISVLLGVAVPALTRTFVFARFLSYAVPGLYLFCAAGLDGTAERLKLKRGLVALLAAPTLLVLIMGLAGYYRLGKQALRPAAEWIKQHAPNTQVLTVGIISDVFRYYYPQALELPHGAVLSSSLLRHIVVVISYPSQIDERNLDILKWNCPSPVSLPSAIEPDFEVRIYRCEGAFLPEH